MVSLEPGGGVGGTKREWARNSAFSEASPRAPVICPTDFSYQVPGHFEFMLNSPEKGLFIYHSLYPKSALLFFRGKYGGKYASFSPLEGKDKVIHPQPQTALSHHLLS